MIKIEFKCGASELAKVLQYYGMLERDSLVYKIVCPFHADKMPSLQVNLEDGKWFCFGCQDGGDALKFVKMMNSKLNDFQACKKYFCILRSRKTKSIKVKQTVKRDCVKIDEQSLIEAKDDYFGLKTVDWRKNSCNERSYMIGRGFTPAALNLCKAKINYNVNYPIMFPMYDLGEFKGWNCRTTNSDVAKKRKYLYNKGFSRNNTLVGDYNSKIVVLVEGYMDWLKFRQFGVKHVAAVLGWKLTANQISKLKKQGVEIIVSALDNDVCGIKGTEYVKHFFKVIRFQYPNGVKDAGEMDEETFNKAYEKTKKLLEVVKNGNSVVNQRTSKKVRSKQGKDSLFSSGRKSKGKIPAGRR